MKRNLYVDLCLRAQALRRSYEGIRAPLALALGVAASAYTHQLMNVHRVLTDTQVRHLLADEVGLGKTIQALMILNALRCQGAVEGALIIAPDRLIPQWRDEIMTRAHAAPGEQSYIRLAWEDQLKTGDFALSDIDASRFDVLIVDEMHRLRADVQRKLVQVAPRFKHVLILTATPEFQEPSRHAQLFALLEPTRFALASSSAPHHDGPILSWTEEAKEEVVSAFLGRDQLAAGCDETPREALAGAHCAYRRVIRARRVDYQGALPHRRHLPRIVAPLPEERDRERLMWEYFQHLDQLERSFDRVLLAKRVILSPPSLEQRVDFLRRKGHERRGLLERVKPLVSKHRGDARADELIDVLREIWEEAPTERVLVAAQDNLTVDYLFDMISARLPEVGPLGDRAPLTIARVRQGMNVEAVADLSAQGNETNENIELFQRGGAQLLLAPEAAQVGLNLQCARVLVLYSVPWDPAEVEQWIGRLDRIGNAAAFSSDGEARCIDIYTIASRGLVAQRVVEVMSAFKVFERSVNVDGANIKQIKEQIERAVLKRDLSWDEIARSARVYAQEATQELVTALTPALPWGVERARALRGQLFSMPAAPPALGSSSRERTGPPAWDRALEGMLRLLESAGDYHIRGNVDPESGARFKSLWYQFGERKMYGRRDPNARVIFSAGVDPSSERSPLYSFAYITRRGDIGAPPRLAVSLEINGEVKRRPLRFLSFGERVHDELIDGWCQPPGSARTELDVRFFDDHELWERGGGGVYVARFTLLDAAALLGDDVYEEVIEALVDALYEGPDDLPRVKAGILRHRQPLLAALEADRRWLRAHLPARLGFTVSRWRAGRWSRVGDDEARALMDPLAHKRRGAPTAGELHLSRTEAREVEAQLASSRAQVGGGWAEALCALEEVVEARLYILEEERRDEYALARERVLVAARRCAEAREGGQPAQMTRAANALIAEQDELALTQARCRARIEWTRAVMARASTQAPVEQLVAVIRARATS